MVNHLYPDFLVNPDQYAQAVRYWQELWSRIDRHLREPTGWVSPWLDGGPPDIRDGNPIFTAWSPSLMRGIRIIQHPPESDGPELAFWTDTFGGPLGDPNSIDEFVMACALSEEVEPFARLLVEAWISGEAIYIEHESHAMVGARPPRIGAVPRAVAVTDPVAA